VCWPKASWHRSLGHRRRKMGNGFYHITESTMSPAKTGGRRLDEGEWLVIGVPCAPDQSCAAVPV
jgi:hypothetical protein